MTFSESHVVRFEADGRLWSEQRIAIPRPDRALDAAFIEQLADDYVRAMRAPLVGDVLVFDQRQVTYDAQRARISWEVVGGAMRSRRAPNGGLLSFEATLEQSGAVLSLIIRVEDYTTRLIDLVGRRLGIILYHATQGLSHKTLTLRFLREQARLLGDSNKVNSQT
jgi:hypothetical protein